MKRLQGHEWHEYRRQHHLILMFVSVSKSGNYRADMIDEDFKHVYHWLNPWEVERLEKSGYLDSHKVFDSNVVCRGGKGEHLKEIREKIKSFKEGTITLEDFNKLFIDLSWGELPRPKRKESEF